MTYRQIFAAAAFVVVAVVVSLGQNFGPVPSSAPTIINVADYGVASGVPAADNSVSLKAAAAAAYNAGLPLNLCVSARGLAKVTIPFNDAILYGGNSNAAPSSPNVIACPSTIYQVQTNAALGAPVGFRTMPTPGSTQPSFGGPLIIQGSLQVDMNNKHGTALLIEGWWNSLIPNFIGRNIGTGSWTYDDGHVIGNWPDSGITVVGVDNDLPSPPNGSGAYYNRIVQPNLMQGNGGAVVGGVGVYLGTSPPSTATATGSSGSTINLPTAKTALVNDRVFDVEHPERIDIGTAVTTVNSGNVVLSAAVLADVTGDTIEFVHATTRANVTDIVGGYLLGFDIGIWNAVAGDVHIRWPDVTSSNIGIMAGGLGVPVNRISVDTPYCEAVTETCVWLTSDASTGEIYGFASNSSGQSLYRNDCFTCAVRAISVPEEGFIINANPTSTLAYAAIDRIPAAVFDIWALAAGGGGGGSAPTSAANTASVGAPGAPGTFVRARCTDAQGANNPWTVSVGAKGTGVAGANGTPGGDTTITGFVQPNWAAEHTYNYGDFIQPVTGNAAGIIYKMITRGSAVSGSSPPTWNQSLATFMRDGSAVWQAVSAHLVITVGGGAGGTTGGAALADQNVMPGGVATSTVTPSTKICDIISNRTGGGGQASYFDGVKGGAVQGREPGGELGRAGLGISINGSAQSVVGNAATGNGAGGSGAITANGGAPGGSGNPGGDGTAGLVTVREYMPRRGL